MRRSEAEDAGGLTPVKDDNKAAPHFIRRTLLVFNCFDYICHVLRLPLFTAASKMA